MRYDTVLFDLDGTLLDTLQDLAESVNEFLRLHNLPERSLKEIRSYLGCGAGELIQRALPQRVDEKKLEEYLGEYRGIYEKNISRHTGPYEGIVPFLQELRKNGIKTAVISNKPDWATKKLASDMFGDLLDAALGDRKDIRRKPDPEPLQVIMAQLSADPASTLFVGDSEVDIETAKNTGLAGCAVTWGYRDEEDLLSRKPDHIARTPDELLELILTGNLEERK